ncbi:hypothetical protein [Deferrisoma camini]|nr:hypothetical protein [Deferrisoma camini]
MRPTFWLVALVLALALAMLLTLWAGHTGRIRTLHGAEGTAPAPVRNRAS